MKNQMPQKMTMCINNYPQLVDETMNIFNTFVKTCRERVGKKLIKKQEHYQGGICSKRYE